MYVAPSREMCHQDATDSSGIAKFKSTNPVLISCTESVVRLSPLVESRHFLVWALWFRPADSRARGQTAHFIAECSLLRDLSLRLILSVDDTRHLIAVHKNNVLRLGFCSMAVMIEAEFSRNGSLIIPMLGRL
jgi:hypothetical protein